MTPPHDGASSGVSLVPKFPCVTTDDARNEDGGLLAALGRLKTAQAVDCAAFYGTINSLRLRRWQFSRLTP